MDRNVNNELISGYSRKKNEKKDILNPGVPRKRNVFFVVEKSK